MSVARTIAAWLLGVSLAALGMSPAQAALASIAGIHVHYAGEEAVARHALAAMRAMCAKAEVSGTADLVGRYTLDVYFAADGTRIARYRQGYVAKPQGPCRIAVEPYSKIDLYHLDRRVRYEFAARGNKGPDWMTHPLPGGWTAARLNDALEAGTGLEVSAGGAGRFAGLACEFHAVQGRAGKVAEYCDRVLDGARPPIRLELMSRLFNPATGETLSYREAETLNLSARLERTLFYPPDGYAAKPGRRPAISDPMRKWCEKQRRETGADPCTDDPEDDED
ncbi:MAG: hypothetical protein HGA75_01010 [Thiobacillus sp.]|nr:hypothetical protein [Thiobacillus sp.]